jgi:hypothetical protein
MLKVVTSTSSTLNLSTAVKPIKMFHFGLLFADAQLLTAEMKQCLMCIYSENNLQKYHFEA